MCCCVMRVVWCVSLWFEVVVWYVLYCYVTLCVVMLQVCSDVVIC